MPTRVDNQKLMEKLEDIITIISQMNKERFAEQYLTDSELCNLFNITRKTAQAWRDSGQLPYARIGKRIYYRNKDIQNLFDIEIKKVKPPKEHKSRSKKFKADPKSNGWLLNVY